MNKPKSDEAHKTLQKLEWHPEERIFLRRGLLTAQWTRNTFCPPTKSLLPAATSCQISCQSDTQIWTYSYLNFFAYLAWNAYSGTQNWGFGGLWTLTCDYSSSWPPKGIFLRKSASFMLSTVIIRWGVWPVGELTESVTDTHTHTHTHR